MNLDIHQIRPLSLILGSVILNNIGTMAVMLQLMKTYLSLPLTISLIMYYIAGFSEKVIAGFP